MDTISMNSVESSVLEDRLRDGKKPIHILKNPTDEKVQEVVNSVLEDVTKTQLKALEPHRRLYYLADTCLERFKGSKTSPFRMELRYRILDCIRSYKTPIRPEILHCLILDSRWEEHIELHEYVGLLLHTEIDEIRQELNAYQREGIKDAMKRAVKAKKKELKKDFKNSKCDVQEKVDSLVLTCLDFILKNKLERIEGLLIDLPKRKVTREEVAKIGLPCGRNMLEECLKDPIIRWMYEKGSMASPILDIYLPKEEQDLADRIQVYLLNSPKILKNFKITLPADPHSIAHVEISIFRR